MNGFGMTEVCRKSVRKTCTNWLLCIMPLVNFAITKCHHWLMTCAWHCARFNSALAHHFAARNEDQIRYPVEVAGSISAIYGSITARIALFVGVVLHIKEITADIFTAGIGRNRQHKF